MKPRLPDGWPGIVGMIVLIGGTVALHSTPATTPLGGVAGPASGYLGEFFYASVDGPQDMIDIRAATAAYQRVDELIAAVGEDGYADRHRSVVALFASGEDAAAGAQALSVPDGASIVVMDRMLMVIGLPTAMGDDPTPIAEELRTSADVLVEGDRYGEGSIVLDLACTAPDSTTAAAISTALGDYGAMPYYTYLRPPWLGEPLTDDEALARSTYRRWAASYQSALQSDPWIRQWSERYIAAATDEERRGLMQEMTDHIQAAQPSIGGETHPGVLALLNRATQTDPDAYLDWGFALGTLAGMVPTDAADGRPTWFEQRHGAQIGAVRASGTRVEIGWVSFNTFALAGSGLLSYLDEQGCFDVRIALSDFDDVRGD